MSGKQQKQKRKRPESVNWDELNSVPGFPGYFITREGKVFSVSELTTFEGDDGYIRVNTYKDGKIKRPGVHVLLAKTFLPNANKERTIVRHLDGVKKNINLNNLAWGTSKENGSDTSLHGTLKGENNPKAKLKTEDVANIKKLLKTTTIKSISEMYDWVSQSTIEAISSGQNWKHVLPAD